MKTALILGGAAIAIYVVWKFGTAAAGSPLAASSAPLAAGNSPYPAAPAVAPILTPAGVPYTPAQWAALTPAQRTAAARADIVAAGARQGVVLGTQATRSNSTAQPATNNSVATQTPGVVPGTHVAPPISGSGVQVPTTNGLVSTSSNIDGVRR